MRSAACLLIAGALGGCSASDEAAPADPPPVAEEPSPFEFLSPTEHLVRASMALTGTRPTPEALRTVRDDATAIGRLVDGYLETDGFGEMVRDLYNEALQVRVGAAIFPAGFPPMGDLADLDLQTINTSVTEAPLRLVEHVVRNDRPLTEILTADYGLADGIVASVWGMTHSGERLSWEESRYEDGREHAGLLSDSWLFTRHSTTFSNQNRGRANTVSRALLCTDYIDRELSADTSINLADPGEVASAVIANPACVGCHQTLDPLAAYFASYSPAMLAMTTGSYPVSSYQPTLAPLYSARDPGYYGYVGGGVRYLGSIIADDPRFSLCTARRFYAYMHQIPLDDVPQVEAASLQGVLIEQSFSAKALAKAIVLSDAFRIRQPASGADDSVEGGNLLKARPWQLARLFDSVAGVTWESTLDIQLPNGPIGRVDLMRDSLLGYEVLAGGIDSQNVSLPAHTMTATTSLVLGGLAAQGADAIAEHDLGRPTDARVLVGVDPSDTSDDAVRAVLVEAFLRIHGTFEEPSSEAVTAAATLFRGALTEASGDASRAWTTTLYALLQDVGVAYY